MILVTGGAGFIGSNLVKSLNLLGREDIVIVDKLESDGKWKNLRSLKFAELIDRDEFPSAIDEFDFEIIYHLGASSSTTVQDMDFLLKNNVVYSQFLFDYAIEEDIPFIYASSAATYGGGEKGYSDGHEMVNELRPLNPYGYSKQLFDQWALRQESTPPKWYGLKFFNVYGPNEYHKGFMQSIVNKSHQQIKEVGYVKLFKSYHPDYSDGGQTRDFVYVKDAVQAMIELSQSNATPGLYNIGTGKPHSFEELTRATFKAMAVEPRIEYIEMPESIKGQYQYFTKASTEKISEALPSFKWTPMEKAVADYVNQHLEKDDPFV